MLADSIPPSGTTGVPETEGGDGTEARGRPGSGARRGRGRAEGARGDPPADGRPHRQAGHAHQLPLRSQTGEAGAAGEAAPPSW